MADLGIWKICNKLDDTFSTGGCRKRNNKWTVNGKSWTSLAKLMQHVLANEEYYTQLAEDVEIVKLRVEFDETRNIITEIRNHKIAKGKRKKETEKKYLRARLEYINAERNRIIQKLDDEQIK